MNWSAPPKPSFFVYMITPRSELITIWQVTPDPLS